MAFIVTGQCLYKDLCPTCLGPELCPTEALQSRDNISYVDTAMCIDCGICEVACPHGMLRTTTPVFAGGRWKLSVPSNADYLLTLNDELSRRAHAN